ncbi:serine kinase [Dickeya fangzhongdai]|uniref:serine kinase n=1 Tax=Dickeya fangzhongdai TaxID=1778540 RepID=UPI0026E0EF50|nr:serine kinase [Dickeya fangzhongdai]WKV50829.1 serine kinase [Dickeya fangzhongdai]
MISMADDNDALRWSRWWCYVCLRQADPSWREAAVFSESEMALAPVHHAAMRRCFGVAEAFPPAPESTLLQLGQLEVGRRRQVLQLMAAVCRETPGDLPEALAVWCRRLAKALRPGLWLPPSLTFDQHRERDALIVLRCRFPPACWSRLQLLYPRDWRDGAGQPLGEALPASRIASLCDAIIWKAADGNPAAHEVGLA